jgi:hypothetical protein
MNGSQKIHAPKPVRASSNINGVKISCKLNFEKIDEKHNQPFSSYTPKIVKYFKDIGFKKRVISSFNFKMENYLNLNEDSSNPFKTFEKDFKTMSDEHDDFMSKSEILCILKNDSTFYESSIYRSENFCSGEEYTFEDEITMPPIRVKNPFHKNIENLEDDEYFEALGDTYMPK